MTGHVADVVVVGAGPSGLALATALRQQGIARVVVLEREPVAGGIPRHCGHPPFGFFEFGRIMTGPSYAKRLAEMAVAAGVDMRLAASVIDIITEESDQAVTFSTPQGMDQIRARRVVLATGVRENARAARLTPGDRPLGIINTGALQAYAYLEGLAPFARPVIIGTELVALSAILTCRALGARPVAMVEQNSRTTAPGLLFALPRLLGIPVLTGTRLTDIRGASRVQAIRVETGGVSRDIDCDGVILTGDFLPESHLARRAGLLIDPGTGGPVIDQFGRCSNPAIYATGNLLHPVETAGWCFREGRAIAGFVSRDLQGTLPGATGTSAIHLADAFRFCVPQRLAPLAEGMPMLQVRLNRSARGTLTVTDSKGATLFRSRLASHPERRITLPLAPLARGCGDLSIQLSGEHDR